MPDAMKAVIKQVLRSPYQVVIERTTAIQVFEGGKLVAAKSNTGKPQEEWRVDVIVDEEFGGEKAATLVRNTQEEAAKLVVGAVAYHF